MVHAFRPFALALVVLLGVPMSERMAVADGVGGAVARASWAGATPEGRIAAYGALARTGPPGDALAALLLLRDEADDAAPGHAARVLRSLGASLPHPDLRAEALLLAADLESESPPGIATEWLILGPFRDTGGGLDSPMGPELAPSFAKSRDAAFDWGPTEVRWRPIPKGFASAAGIPLDVFVAPRKESCTFLATRAEGPQAPYVVRLASSGQVRLLIDGELAGRSEDVHSAARVDRMAVTVPGGAHQIVVKVCSGSQEDAGRVRVRFTSTSGEALSVSTRASLDGPLGAPSVGASRSTAREPLHNKFPSFPTVSESALGAASPTVAGIVLRTIGGADDVRSPRAPGLAESYLQAFAAGRAKLTPSNLRRSNLTGTNRAGPEPAGTDLAGAALVASSLPSRASASGWLERVRDAASKENDGEVTAFVERHLVALRLRARLGDWALTTFERGRLERATDGEAARLLAHALFAQGPEDSRRRAFEVVDAAAKRLGDGAPSALLRDIGSMGRSFSAARSRDAYRILAKRKDVPSSDTAVAVGSLLASGSSSDRAMAEALVARALGGRLDAAQDGIALANSLLRDGAPTKARALAETLKDWAPNVTAVWTLLAHARAADASDTRRSKDDAALLQPIERARALSPSDRGLRGTLVARRGEPAEDRTGDLQHLVEPSVFLSRRAKSPSDPVLSDVAERQLHFLRAVYSHADRRVSQLIHYAREITIAPRTQDELYEDVPTEGRLAELVRARVHRVNGSIVDPVEQQSEGGDVRLRWPDLVKGDVVEVAVRTWTDGPVGGRSDYPFFFLDYAGSTATRPVLYNEVVVSTAKEAPLYVDVVGGKADGSEVVEKGGRRIVRHRWTRPTLVPDEPLSPPFVESVPVVLGSTFPSFKAFIAWYKEAVRGFTEPDAEIRRLALDLTKGKVGREAKMAALFQFVADRIRYVNYVSAEQWLPNRPQEVLARREGDCDDKAILLIALLKVIGIDAEEVLVQTRITGEHVVFSAKNAAVPRFDHGIAFVPSKPGSREGRWLDATSPHARMGVLPSMDAGGIAVRLDRDGEVEVIPPARSADHGRSVRWELTLDRSGNAALRGEELHSGDSAFWLRNNLSEEGARKDYVERALLTAAGLPSASLERDVAFEPDLARGTSRVRYSARSEGFAKWDGDAFSVSLAPSVPLTAELAPLVTRTLALVLPPHLAPSHDERQWTLRAPSGAQWVDLPESAEIDGGAFGKASLRVTRVGSDRVRIERKFSLDVPRIEPHRYAEFRSYLLRVDGLFRAQFRYSRAPEPAGRGERTSAR